MANANFKLLLLSLLWSHTCASTVHVSLYDSDRNRDVTAIICLPDESTDDGKLDLQIFAHGGGLYAADYEYLCSDEQSTYAIARLGSNATDNPMDLQLMADDITFLGMALPSQSKSHASSPLYDRLSGRVVLLGHSMGAAAALLAGRNQIKGVVAVGALAPGFWGAYQAKLLAKLGSEPSALCERPLLVVEGDQDCANSLTLQGLPVWGNISSSCRGAPAKHSRFLALVKGATHCQWTTPVQGSCTFDVPCPAPRLDRSRQQDFGNLMFDSLNDNRVRDLLLDMKAKDDLSFVDEWSKQSDVSKLHSECPCKKPSDHSLLI